MIFGLVGVFFWLLLWSMRKGARALSRVSGRRARLVAGADLLDPLAGCGWSRDPLTGDRDRGGF